MTALQHLSHILIAMAIQGMVFLVLGSWWAGAAAAVFFFAGREIAQAEYRWIEANGGLRKLMPMWQGLDVRAWSGHSRAGVLLPLVAVCAAAALFPIINTTH